MCVLAAADTLGCNFCVVAVMAAVVVTLPFVHELDSSLDGGEETIVSSGEETACASTAGESVP